MSIDIIRAALAEIEATHKKATGGEWKAEYENQVGSDGEDGEWFSAWYDITCNGRSLVAMEDVGELGKDNAKFIIDAHNTTVPLLLQALGLTVKALEEIEASHFLEGTWIIERAQEALNEIAALMAGKGAGNE